jgi:DNA-binding protein YbaB
LSAVISALNRALENGEKKYEEEMKDVAGDMLGGIGM